MNIKQLKRLIADLPDDLEIVKSSYDHSYQDIESVVQCKAERFQTGELVEFWNEHNKSKQENEVINVLLIG